MKKNSLRVSALVLACVPLLLGSTTLVNAEEATKDTTETVLKADAADETVKEDEVTAVDKDKADEATKKFKLELKDEIKTKVGSKGVINLPKLNGKELKGTFETEKPADKEDLVTINEKGEWTALKDGKSDVKLFFIPDTATKELLKKEYPKQEFGDKIPVENVSFIIEKKDTTTPPTGNEKLKLTLKSTIGKDKKGKLSVDHKGTPLTAEFNEIKDGKIILAKDGSFTIPETNKESKFTQEVTFKLNDSDPNFKKLQEAQPDKTIELTYKQTATIEVSSTGKKDKKPIKLTFKTNTLKADFKNAIPDKPWDEGTGKLEINDVEGVKITGTYTEIKDSPYISLDKNGQWNALKPGKGDFTPGFEISKESKEALQKKNPEKELEITIDKVNVDFVDTTNSGNGNTGTPGGKTAKDYVPVNKLPQTGEEKMKFAGVIGAVVIVIAGIIFFMKKKKGSDDTEA